jgi:hypothetical protein
MIWRDSVRQLPLRSSSQNAAASSCWDSIATEISGRLLRVESKKGRLLGYAQFVSFMKRPARSHMSSASSVLPRCFVPRVSESSPQFIQLHSASSLSSTRIRSGFESCYGISLVSSAILMRSILRSSALSPAPNTASKELVQAVRGFPALSMSPSQPHIERGTSGGFGVWWFCPPNSTLAQDARKEKAK